MNTKNISIGVLVAVALVLGVLVVKQPTVIGVPTTIKLDASTLGAQKAPNVTVEAAKPVVVPAPVVNVNIPRQEVQNRILGSVTGPDTYFPYTANNDVKTYSYSSKFLNSTTTPCAYKTPAATSTIQFMSLQVNTGTSTATTWYLATSTTAYATTTNLATISVGSGNQASAHYQSVTGTGVIAPNTYLVWGIAGLYIGSDSVLRGTCQAVVRTLY